MDKKINTKKELQQAYLWNNLLLCCHEGTATAETFENYIKAYGMEENVLIAIISYYGDDYKNNLMRFSR